MALRAAPDPASSDNLKYDIGPRTSQPTLSAARSTPDPAPPRTPRVCIRLDFEVSDTHFRPQRGSPGPQDPLVQSGPNWSQVPGRPLQPSPDPRPRPRAAPGGVTTSVYTSRQATFLMPVHKSRTPPRPRSHWSKVIPSVPKCSQLVLRLPGPLEEASFRVHEFSFSTPEELHLSDGHVRCVDAISRFRKARVANALSGPWKKLSFHLPGIHFRSRKTSPIPKSPSAAE